MYNCESWPPHLNNDELRERIMGKPVIELTEDFLPLDVMDSIQTAKRGWLPLCKENAAYWRAFESPHICWLQDHIDYLKKQIMKEYNSTSLQHAYLADIPQAHDCLMTSLEVRFGLYDKQRQLNNWKKDREEYLDAYAQFVRFECHGSNMRKLTSVSVSAYKNRGTSSGMYACGQILPYIKRLESEGFSSYQECKDERVVLYANCYEWIFDAMCRRITVGEARKVFEAENLDPNAYVSINHNGHYLRSTCNI